MYNQIDIDRLHKNLEAIEQGNYLGRQSGQTTAVLHKMLGVLELGEHNTMHLIITYNSMMARIMVESFKSIINTEGYADYVERVQKRGSGYELKTIDGKRFWFLGISSIMSHTFRGTTLDSVTFDLDPLAKSKIKDSTWQDLQICQVRR